MMCLMLFLGGNLTLVYSKIKYYMWELLASLFEGRVTGFPKIDLSLNIDFDRIDDNSVELTIR